MSLMEALPRDVRSYLAGFLEPLDFRSLCLISRSFATLGRDETLFANWYRREFLVHVRENTSADVEKALGIATTLHRAEIHGRFTRAFASAEQIALLLELKMEPGWTWKRLFTGLYCIKRGMMKEMRNCLRLLERDGFASCRKPPLAGSEAPPFIVYKTDKPDEDTCLISCGSIVPRELVEVDEQYLTDDAAFSPDFTCSDESVRIDDLKLFHKVFLARKKQNHPGFDALYHGPPLGLELVCVFEGICYWNALSQKYHLVYPMCGLRRLYQRCRQQVATECEQLQKRIHKELTRAAIFRFKVKAAHVGIAKRNITAVEEQLVASLEKDYNLRANSVVVEMLRDISLSQKEATMTLTVVCSPYLALEFSDSMCLDCDCRENSVEKGLDVDERWRTSYCNNHSPVDENEHAMNKNVRTTWSRSDLFGRYYARKLDVQKNLWIAVSDPLDSNVEHRVHLKEVRVFEAAMTRVVQPLPSINWFCDTAE
jgi:hypothetical protein